uniref:Uncharacterized protein n=1 Tax=Amphimedon queenslandica TaxID=400682 RepID=A0A1X7SPW3_AMPQE
QNNGQKSQRRDTNMRLMRERNLRCVMCMCTQVIIIITVVVIMIVI